MKNYLLILIFVNTLFANFVDTSRVRDFSLRYGGENTNIIGDFTFTGASVLCVKNGNECDWNYDGYLYDADTKYVKDDLSFSLNSASAILNLPSEVTKDDIQWAGLYWQGHIEGSNPLDADEEIEGFNSIVLKTPDGVKHTITAPLDDNNFVNYYFFKSEDQNPKGFRFFYQCFADVTSLVKNSYSKLQKTFTVGEIKTTEGEDPYLADPLFNWNKVKYGHWGGWSLIVVYKRSSSDESLKNISIFDGFKFLIPSSNEPSKSIEIPIEGFLTPLSGKVDSRLLFFAMGGEKKIHRDSMQIYKQHAGIFKKVYNAVNSENNVLNGSVSFMGEYINPLREYVPGFDLDLFDSSNIMENDQNKTKLKLSAIFQNHNGDQAFTGVIAFSTKINSPLIDNFLKTSNKGAEEILRPSDEIEYTLDFKNRGTERASEITIYDDFRENNLTNFIENDRDFILRSIRLSADNDDSHFYCYEGEGEDCDFAFDSSQSCDVDVDENDSVIGVHCTFDSLDIDHRRVMKFRIKIKKDFISPNDILVKNIAHSKYKNARTNKWVEAIGKSNPYIAGRIRGILVDSGNFDVVDNILDGYAPNKGLKTKIAKEKYDFDIVTLDDSLNPKPFNNYSNITFLFRLIDLDNPSYSYLLKDASLNPVTAVFHNGGNYARTLTKALMPSYVIKRAKLKIKYLNFAKLYKKRHNSCFVNSNNSSNIKGMPQCVNSSSLYKTSFGEAAFHRCILANGSPCASSHHGVGNSPYDHIYGCYECTADALGSYFISSDDFSIRPYMFELDLPSKEVSGKNFSFRAKALDRDLNPITNYNESLNSSYKIEYKERKSGCIKGNINLSGADFLNGVINKTTFYDEIGVVDFNISEVLGIEFAAIDLDDTPKSLRLIPFDSSSIEFVPDSFKVVWSLQNADSAKNYTYYSNDLLNMGGKLKVALKAQNRLGNVVKNYNSSCYAKDCNITVYFDALGSETSALVLKWLDFDNPSHKNDNALGFNLPANNLNFKVDLSFGEFSNGENNKSIMINFKREKNKPLEPMRVKIFKVSANDGEISGFSSHSEYLTFYYSRAKVLDYLNIVGDFLNDAPIFYETYCKNCDKTVFSLANGGLSESGELYWYKNNFHTLFDGKILSTSSVNGTLINDLQLKNFDLKAPTLPHSDTIYFTPSPWLIYDSLNPSADKIKFNVSFISPQTKWVGVGRLGHIVDENISIKKNRKISW